MYLSSQIERSALRQYINVQYICTTIQPEYHISYEYIYKFDEINNVSKCVFQCRKALYAFKPFTQNLIVYFHMDLPEGVVMSYEMLDLVPFSPKLVPVIFQLRYPLYRSYKGG